MEYIKRPTWQQQAIKAYFERLLWKRLSLHGGYSLGQLQHFHLSGPGFNMKTGRDDRLCFGFMDDDAEYVIPIPAEAWNDDEPIAAMRMVLTPARVEKVKDRRWKALRDYLVEHPDCEEFREAVKAGIVEEMSRVYY